MKKLLISLSLLCCTAVYALAQSTITLPIAANAVADIGNGPIKVRMVAGNASIFTAQSSGTGSTSGSSTALTLTTTPATPPFVGGLISGTGITSGTTVTAYNGTTGVTLSAAMTVAGGTTVSWGAACPSTPPSNVIQASPMAGYFIMYTQARVCAVSPGGPVNTFLIEPIFTDVAQPVTVVGAVTPGDCASFLSVTQIQDAATACGAALTVQTTQTAAYHATAVSVPCGTLIPFNITSTGATPALTIDAASGYPAGCQITAANIGIYTGTVSARGVNLTVNGLTPNNPILFPGQSTQFTNVSGAWVETGYGWRHVWKPNVNATFFSDASSGSSANDGLASGAGALDTINNGFNKLFNFVDWSGGAAQARFSIAGTFASGDILHMAGPLRGGAGNLQLLLSATTGSPVVTASNGNPCIAVFDAGVISISGITCNAAGTNTFCWETNDVTGKIFFETAASTCIPGTGGAFFANGGAFQFDVSTNIGTSGGGTTGSFFNGGTLGNIFFNGAFSISILGSYTVTETVFVGDRSGINFNGTTFNLNAHTITGTRFVCNYWSNIFGTSAAPNTFIPGTVNGTVGSDCNAP